MLSQVSCAVDHVWIPGHEFPAPTVLEEQISNVPNKAAFVQPSWAHEEELIKQWSKQFMWNDMRHLFHTASKVMLDTFGIR